MIQSLQERAAFWAEHHRVPCQGDSIAAPFTCFTDWNELVTGRRVLEIGPGEGRQFRQCAPLAAGYSIADIAPRVLENPMYEGAGKHLITSYATDDLGEKFDVICFWYVLHHVLRSEGPAFFAFVERHLAGGGDLLFNTPGASQSRDLGGGHDGNGTETTPWRQEDVARMMREAGLAPVRSQELAHNCLVIHARRR